MDTHLAPVKDLSAQKVKVLDLFLFKPILMAEALDYLYNYLRSHTIIQAEDRAALIQQVRQMAALSLQESKEVVSVYLDYHPQVFPA